MKHLFTYSIFLLNTFFLIGFLCSCGSPTSTANIYENTTRSGPIYSDERWKGIINVTGDIDIHGGTLTIDPGTTVKFAAGSDDRKGGSTTPYADPYFPHDPAIAPSQICAITVFNGGLCAVGTPDQKITFTSSSAAPAASDWDILQFNRTDGRMNIQNAIIEYGYFGVGINTTADDNRVVIKNNTVRNVVAAGITCGSSSSTTEVSITISGNTISKCGHEGIATYPGNNLTIEGNSLQDIKNEVDGGGAGVVIEKNNATVRDNAFLRNRKGIIITDKSSSPSLSGNTFEANEEDIAYP